MLLIHSKDDTVIPYSQGLNLYKHFINAQHLKTTGNHLSFFRFPFNRKKIFNFFQKNKDYQFEQIIIFDVNQTDNISIKDQDINLSESNITNIIKKEDNNLSKGKQNV